MKRLSSSLRLLLLAIWCLSAMPGNAAEASRPNILFLLTDDQRDNTLGALLLAPMAQQQAGATTSLTQDLRSAADHPRSPLPAFV